MRATRNRRTRSALAAASAVVAGTAIRRGEAWGLLSDPGAVARFAEHDVVLPLVVVSELEGKRDHPELGYFARTALRFLDDLRLQHAQVWPRRARCRQSRARREELAPRLADVVRGDEQRAGAPCEVGDVRARGRSGHSQATGRALARGRQRIREGFGRPEAVPVWQLPGFIAGLERAGFSVARHKVWLQMELARPFLMGAMVLIAASTIFA